MSALDHLRALGRGDTPANDGLLGNARCGWGRGELIGEEAILAAFCAKPFGASEAVAVENAFGAALVSADDALMADTYDGRIGRLWRVGSGIVAPREPAIDLSFDPDMRQQRGDAFFRAEDHPGLDGAAGERIRAATRQHVDDIRRSGGLRVRGFVIRAFGEGPSSAALVAVYTLSSGPIRSSSFSHAIIGLGADGETRVVAERTSPPAWKPRF